MKRGALAVTTAANSSSSPMFMEIDSSTCVVLLRRSQPGERARGDEGSLAAAEEPSSTQSRCRASGRPEEKAQELMGQGRSMSPFRRRHNAAEGRVAFFQHQASEG